MIKGINDSLSFLQKKGVYMYKQQFCIGNPRSMNHLAIEIASDSKKLIEKMNQFYYGFKSEKQNLIPDVIIHLGSSQRWKHKSKIQKNNTHKNYFFNKLGDNTLCIQSSYKLAHWIAYTQFSDWLTSIHGDSWWKGYDILNIKYIRKLLYILTAFKGIPFLHASAVMKNNKGIIFIADQGVGKSYFARSLMKYGWKIYGDEIVAIHKNKMYYSMTGVPLFFSNMRYLGMDKFTKKQKLGGFFAEAVFKGTMRFYEMPIYYNPPLPENKESISIKTIIHLKKGKRFRFQYDYLHEFKEYMEQPDESIQWNNILEESNIKEIGDILSIIETYDESIAQKYRSMLREALPTNIPFCELEFPLNDMNCIKYIDAFGDQL